MKKATMLLTLAAPVLMASAANADPVWHIAADNGQKAPVAEVAYLMAADSEPTFSIILNDGSIIDNVASASFEMSVQSGINAVTADRDATVKYVGNTLTIMGAGGKRATIYSLNGNTAMEIALSGETSTIDISGLAPAVYLLNIGDTTIRFIKK